MSTIGAILALVLFFSFAVALVAALVWRDEARDLRESLNGMYRREKEAHEAWSGQFREADHARAEVERLSARLAKYGLLEPVTTPGGDGGDERKGS